ncbi:SAVED domain-containing protein [Scytonema sp. NUACC26]|uniref:SAVED domain-containing protein n=1 Tax=Scytonema sp. NUACC26 TaxID=3140176 RepID=UPI0034DC9E3B
MTTSPIKRILILAANPTNTTRLRLDEEVREIKKALRCAPKRDQFELVSCWAVTPRELQLAVLEESPQIVHFCGHGMGDEGLVLQDETGQVKFVSTNALAGLFKLFANKVECVLLNACYSELQAEVIKHHIDYVIGMNQSLGDRTAIEFAVSFYEALGADKNYDFAYEYACNGISMAGIDQANVPVLHRKSFSFDVNNNTYLSLWVHGWDKQIYSNSPTVELDWTEHFDIYAQPRRIADQATWDNILLPNLNRARKELTQGHTPLTIDVRGRFPLTVAVAIGTVFPDTRGYTLQVEQQTAGKLYLWRSDASPSDAKFKVVSETGEAGEHLLIALGITGNPSLDVAQLLQDSPIPFSAVIYAEPEFGTGERAIRSDADAVALVLDVKDLIRRYRQKYSATCTHLVLFAPVGFCLFLGQRLRVIGDIICYERIADRNYQPSVKLCTG